VVNIIIMSSCDDANPSAVPNSLHFAAQCGITLRLISRSLGVSFPKVAVNYNNINAMQLYGRHTTILYLYISFSPWDLQPEFQFPYQPKNCLVFSYYINL